MINVVLVIITMLFVAYCKVTNEDARESFKLCRDVMSTETYLVHSGTTEVIFHAAKDKMHMRNVHFKSSYSKCNPGDYFS